MTTGLVGNVAELLSLSMAGGSMKGSSSQSVSQKGTTVLMYIFITILVIFIKAYIVYLGYNYMMPRLIFSLSKEKNMNEVSKNFKPIGYVESLILVIFANTLFSAM
jgi:hypothetical protein